MLCKLCSTRIAVDDLPLCSDCLESVVVKGIRKEQSEQGYHACFKTGSVFCDHSCKYMKLCLLKDWTDGRAILDACRSIQYAEGNPACCGKTLGGDCSREKKCLFGKVCVPKNVGFRWISIPDSAARSGHFNINFV